MAPKSPATFLPPLVPERHPGADLFLCDVSDAVLKDVIPTMEHPFFALSTKPDLEIRRYVNGDNVIEVVPSVKGIATIYDKDILIYCVSQIMGAINAGREVSKRVRISSYDLLAFANRGHDGRAYKRLSEAIDRLAGTRIKTNVRTGNEIEETFFGLIDSAALKRTEGLDGRLLYCEITLSDWLFKAIAAREVLTLHRDYFRLRKPIERRVYEIARKHCGHKKTWRIKLALLHNKCGSRGNERLFREAIREMARLDHLPDYAVRYDRTADTVEFVNRETMIEPLEEVAVGRLDGDTYEAARQVCPGWDIFAVEAEWRVWMEDGGMEMPANPDRAFIGFARKFYERRGSPR